MRLTRLMIGRYGHLSDVELVFPAGHGLHIVLGANEAGKSTALAAIGDCLFGFPHRTPYAFLHATRDLRIGATLRAQDGREATIVRRKGRKEDLLDAQDRPLAQAVIANFLGGATRERFDRIYGLDGDELRRGGDSILRGEGEVGEQIVSAHTGLRGFRDLVARLDGDAGKLFGDRRGRREFHEAADRFRQARERVGARKIEPADYKQAQDELARLNRIRADNAIRARALHGERARLDRIRRTTPARLALVTALENRKQLGVVAILPDDAAACFQDAIARRDQAANELTRAQTLSAELEAALRELPAVSPVLTEAAAIAALNAHRERIVGTERDREEQRLVAAQCAMTITDAGRRLGSAADAATLVGRIPSTLDREKVNRTLRRHEYLQGRHAKAVEDLDAAAAKAHAADLALQALPPADPGTELRQAIEAVRAEGRLDEDLSDAEVTYRSAVDKRDRALRSLPLWTGDVDALAAAPVPLDAVIQRHADALKAKQVDLQQSTARVVEHDRALSEFAAADQASGDLPTNEAIQAVRTRRDASWAAIRRHYIDGGAPPADIDLPRLADRFDALVHAADHIADRRAAERERVVAVEQRRRDHLRRQILRDADAAACAIAVAAHDRALDAWRALWQPVAVDPAEPAAMREWLQHRRTVLAEHERVADAGHRRNALGRRRDSALVTLAILLPDAAEHAGGQLPALLRAAERLCQQRERQADRRAKASDAGVLAQAEERDAVRGLSRIETDMTSWRAEWEIVAPLLSLAAETPAELGLPALDLWNQLDQVAQQRRLALHRIEEMTAAIDHFAKETIRVVERIAADLLLMPPHDAVIVLARRLAEAAEIARNRRDRTSELERTEIDIRRHQQERGAAEDRLATLRTAAGAADDAALTEAIARSAQHRRLSDLIGEREIELHRLDDGKTREQLTLEAADVDFDSLPARVLETDDQLNAINAEELTNQSRMTELRQTLAAMEQGRDAAGAAQEMATALADIDDVATRYATVRMAHVLLRAGIERFRRQQQGPLLNRAGQIFARLTEGRYDRLGVDEEDGRMLIKACRPDGAECLADRLSEGTLDQLYLALRLAAIESYARNTEPLPFIADDLLVNFDDRRAAAAIRVLADFGKVTQVILFTHHGHIAEMAEAGIASAHPLTGSMASV